MDFAGSMTVRKDEPMRAKRILLKFEVNLTSLGQQVMAKT